MRKCDEQLKCRDLSLSLFLVYPAETCKYRGLINIPGENYPDGVCARARVEGKQPDAMASREIDSAHLSLCVCVCICIIAMFVILQEIAKGDDNV